ncbi:MAG: type III pantothenate kinase [Spirochaetia bacterium]|nr:type III pantothenate kinase [Spirochaetia bacterium]
MSILAVDIGNTNTVFGLFDPDDGLEIRYHWRTVTRRDRTSDELGIFLIGFLHATKVDPKSIQGFIYSSVVPPFNPIVERMALDYFGVEAIRVTHDMGLPITIDYPRPFEIGADRLVNAVAADKLYGGDLIVVDLGTATTFCVVENGHYIGGTIAPGIKLSMEALHRNTAQLPSIEFARPASGVVATSTVEAIQAGFFFGWIGLLRGILDETKRSRGRAYKTIATGGLSNLIQKEAGDLFDVVDVHLTLRGLKMIYLSLGKKQR